MTRLKDVMDVELLKEMIDGGFVTEREHPEESLVIFNYTDKATYANEWNEVTLNCRGLITNLHDRIVARGMAKFFNHNQPEAPEFRPDDVVDVSDKADGSLGILYQLPSTGEWAVATRGSFVSEQAIWATEKLRTMLEDSPRLATFLKTASLAQMTPVVEIVYPENRIVLDYGDMEDLVLLGAVEGTGRFWPVRTAPEWPSRTAEYLGVTSFAGALALPNRENREGLVLTRVSDGTMLKIKQQDYVEKHRAVFGLNARRVWEMLVEAPDRVTNGSRRSLTSSNSGRGIKQWNLN